MYPPGIKHGFLENVPFKGAFFFKKTRRRMARERKEAYRTHMNKKYAERICISTMFKTHVMDMNMRMCEHDEIRSEAVWL